MSILSSQNGELIPQRLRLARTQQPEMRLGHLGFTALHYTIISEMSDTQIIHQLLSQLGIKLTMHWSRISWEQMLDTMRQIPSLCRSRLLGKAFYSGSQFNKSA